MPCQVIPWLGVVKIHSSAIIIAPGLIIISALFPDIIFAFGAISMLPPFSTISLLELTRFSIAPDSSTIFAPLVKVNVCPLSIFNSQSLEIRIFLPMLMDLSIVNEVMGSINPILTTSTSQTNGFSSDHISLDPITYGQFTNLTAS